MSFPGQKCLGSGPKPVWSLLPFLPTTSITTFCHFCGSAGFLPDFPSKEPSLTFAAQKWRLVPRNPNIVGRVYRWAMGGNSPLRTSISFLITYAQILGLFTVVLPPPGTANPTPTYGREGHRTVRVVVAGGDYFEVMTLKVDLRSRSTQTIVWEKSHYDFKTGCDPL